MTCKDCLHYNACKSLLEAMGYTVDGDGVDADKRCDTFEDRNSFAPVVYGRWDGTADGYFNGELVYDIWNCSNCGFDADGADEKPDWNYCPHCGAKMDFGGGGNADNND